MIYYITTPKSTSNSDWDDFEFVIEWYGRDGSFYQKLFYDWENSIKSDTTILNRQDSATMDNIPNKEERAVKLKLNDLSKNDLEIMIGLGVAKIVQRRYNDGTTERLGVDGNSIKYKQRSGRYDFEIDILLYNKRLAQ